MHFSDRLAETIKQKDSCLMLGLDPNWEKLPEHLKADSSLASKAEAFKVFCQAHLEACAPYICGIKIQMGYFEALGSAGVKVVEDLIAHTREKYPELSIMLDAKRGDIGSTSTAYADAFLGDESPLVGDSVTVSPYLGDESIAPFLASALHQEKGVFVLVKTSNPGAAQLQMSVRPETGITNADMVAMMIGVAEAQVLSADENLHEPSECGYSCISAVVGATNGEELKHFRELMPKNWLLCPGVGAQGGDIKEVLAVRDKEGLGVIIPVSRAVLYDAAGQNFAEAGARVMKDLWHQQQLES